MGPLMGRVIDLTQNRDGPKFSEVLDIEDAFQSLGNTRPSEWWSFSVPKAAVKEVVQHLRDRLVCHAQYFLGRVYLHLPYLLKSSSAHLYQTSKATAVHCARELVLRYHSLKSYVNGAMIFDCQSIDFIGFLGAVVLLLGIFNDQKQALTGDVEIIRKTARVLQSLASTSNPLASQCHSTLHTLCSLCLPGDGHQVTIPSTIRIPYFGTLHVKRPQNNADAISSPPQSAVLQPGMDTANDQAIKAVTSGDFEQPIDGTLPAIAYKGPYSFECGLDWAQSERQDINDDSDLIPTLDDGWESFLHSGFSSFETEQSGQTWP
jgi:hypothetical protein